MTTTKQSTFGADPPHDDPAGVPLGGLLVVIGAADRRRPARRALFLGIALLINLGSYFFSDKIALEMSRRQADRGVGSAAALPDRPRTDDPRRAADAAPLHDPPGPAQRLRDRPQPEALGGRGHPRDHQAALRGRAARRARPRARPRPQPRHPDPVGRLGDRRRDHLPRLHAALVRRRRRLAARPGRLAGAGPAGADRGDASSSSRSRASASTRPTPAAPRSAATRSRSPAPCCASRRGRQAMPMQVNQAAEPLYIVKPFSGKGIAGLFSTHPPIEERVRALRADAPRRLRLSPEFRTPAPPADRDRDRHRDPSRWRTSSTSAEARLGVQLQRRYTF